MLTRACSSVGPRRAGFLPRRVARVSIPLLAPALLLLSVSCAPSVLRADASAAGRTSQSATTPKPTTPPPASAPAVGSRVQTGMASWYGPGFAGRRTANGEVFDPSQLTAAHRELPFNTLVRVVNETNGHSVVVRINDRGPFKGGRIIDLSRAGAEAIGMIGAGVARVRLEVLTLPPGMARVGALSSLRGFEVVSRTHPVGTLLALTPRQGGSPVVVRVVSSDVPVENPADLLVGLELYADLGSEVAVAGD